MADAVPMGLPVAQPGDSGLMQQVERIRSALDFDASLSAPAVLAAAAPLMGMSIVAEGTCVHALSCTLSVTRHGRGIRLITGFTSSALSLLAVLMYSVFTGLRTFHLLVSSVGKVR